MWSRFTSLFTGSVQSLDTQSWVLVVILVATVYLAWSGVMRHITESIAEEII